MVLKGQHSEYFYGNVMNGFLVSFSFPNNLCVSGERLCKTISINECVYLCVWCMYICMCVYMCVCMHACMCVCVCMFF